jgi:hypothetical protein
LKTPLPPLRRGVVHVSIKDKAGNITRIDRTFSIIAATASK